MIATDFASRDSSSGRMYSAERSPSRALGSRKVVLKVEGRMALCPLADTSKEDWDHPPPPDCPFTYFYAKWDYCYRVSIQKYCTSTMMPTQCG